MKKPALGAFIFILSTASPTFAQNLYQARVTSVVDGDTVKVKTANNKIQKIRLACIDAPESKQAPWGEQSTKRLNQLLPIGQGVRIRQVDTDKYGRVVGEIYINNRSINSNMVQEGRAVVYTKYLSNCPKLKNSLLNAQKYASSKRLGLWSQANPLMPWDFRRGNYAKKKPVSKKQCEPSYPDICLPVATQDNLNCSDVSHKNFTVLAPDPYRFDGDKDGLGCEG